MSGHEQDSSIDYENPPPTIQRFLESDAFIRGLRGPIGSGKSTTCCFEILRRAWEQHPGPDGVARSRWLVVRNTYPELKTTTIPTWHGVMPSTRGEWRDQGPPRHFIRERHEDGHTVELEVIFLALDSATSDVGKVLSLEITGAWVNEAREIQKAIIDALTGRVGRFPGPLFGGPSWAGLILDTNSPDTEHWWYTLAERDTSTEEKRQLISSLDKAREELVKIGALGKNQPLFEFFAQPGGRSPNAENLANLRAGYYQFAMAGKSADWIKVYVDGEYGFIQEGRPIYTEYVDSLHCVTFELDRGTPLLVGMDFGMTPAAVIGQRNAFGRTLIRWELCATYMGVRPFGKLLAQFLREREQDGYHIGDMVGDPAGDSPDYDEETAFQVLKSAEVGLDVHPAYTNEWSIRREAVATPLAELADGKPRLVIHPDCAVLRKGMAGRYAYKRLALTGEARYKSEPDKNEWSHVCEALQYLMLATGEGKRVVRRENSASRGAAPKYARM